MSLIRYQFNDEILSHFANKTAKVIDLTYTKSKLKLVVDINGSDLILSITNPICDNEHFELSHAYVIEAEVIQFVNYMGNKYFDASGVVLSNNEDEETVIVRGGMI